MVKVGLTFDDIDEESEYKKNCDMMQLRKQQRVNQQNKVLFNKYKELLKEKMQRKIRKKLFGKTIPEIR